MSKKYSSESGRIYPDLVPLGSENLKTAPIDPPESLDPLKRALDKTDKQIFDDDWVVKSLADPPESDWLTVVLEKLEMSAFKDSGEYTVVKAHQAITHRIEEEAKKFFRAGQSDCMEAGDPTTHRYFKEAVEEEVRKARIDEVEGMAVLAVDLPELLPLLSLRLKQLVATDSPKEGSV